MRRLVIVMAWTLALAGVMASTAQARRSPLDHDYAQTSLNIIPSGQLGGLPVAPDANRQALMYDGLTPLFDQVTNSDLTTYFKTERFGLDTSGPGTNEPVPRPGVTITRDQFHVPHVNATTYDGGVWAAGWIVAEDRGLLLQQARNNARVAAIDAPGLRALSLIVGLQNFQPSQQTETEIAKQTGALLRYGHQGRAVLHDIDVFISGINAYLAANSPSTPPWTRNDLYALNALKGQFVGEGGGDEARRSQFLGGLERRLGVSQGLSIFNDLRQFKNEGSPTSIDGRFDYGRIPAQANGSVVLDPGSFQATPSVAARSLARQAGPPPSEPTRASNTLMITADHSETGRPLMVGGPQIGYFYPGLTYEIDMHAPGLVWRGATSPPLPGYMLIGRGPDFATTLTSSSGDIIDQYAETLCEGSDQKYLFRGRCLAMERFDAGTLGGKAVSFLTTVHGPVIGYATVNGRKVAISRKRSSYGKDVVDQLFFRRLSTGRVHSPRSFFKAASLTPQTFNSFYIDSKHIALFTSGRLPLRDRDVDPGLPTKGTGQYEWRGFLPARKHIHGVDPRDGTITNWNNISARGFGAADNQWGGTGSAARVDLLDYNLARLARNSTIGRNGKWSLATVTAAMNAAATQDVRAIDTVPLLVRLLEGAPAPNAQSAQMLSLLAAWRDHGGSRLDRDLDGKIDDPGAAVMDTAWPLIADAFMGPKLGPQLDELNSLFSRFSLPPGGQYDGWYQYFDRDIRSLLGMPVAQPFNNRYCGNGILTACRSAVWQAISQAGAALTTAQGTSNPTLWRSDAVRERISFAPGLLTTTIRYTNRPSGIQQVISFDRHR
ncbi:MAG: penicillin acylase family protein [Actinomycetota bacterium]